jgi:hypothetical protein
LPLDNSASPRPDWYEFWAMRQFLRETPLQPDRWYGFFSPRFGEKTGLAPTDVAAFVAVIGGHADVALFSPFWDQIAYWQNQFERGDVYHPGLLAATRGFLEASGIPLDLANLASDSTSAVFSNYIVARPAFWTAWLALADKFFAFAESSSHPAAESLGTKTRYKGRDEAVAMKVFVQERLASIVLATGPYRAVSIDVSDRHKPPGLLPSPALRALQACDVLKREFRRTGDRTLLEAYRKIRATVPMGRPAST